MHSAQTSGLGEVMKFAIEKFSYRSGELLLNTRPRIRQEIEETLIAPGIDIGTLSRDGYVEVLRAAFLEKGWEHQPFIWGEEGKANPLMDFRKEGVGIRLGFQPNSPQPELLKFHVAQRHPETMIDVGVYVTSTADCQKELARTTGKLWAGPTFHAVVRSLPPLSRLLETPLCIMGLYVYEAPVQIIDPFEMSATVLKQLILEFLEAHYRKPIEKNVRMVSKGLDVYLDGVLHLEDKDIILAIELSRSSGTFPSRLLSDSILRFIDLVREYRKTTGRKVCLRFVLMGNFSQAFIQDIFGQAGIAYGWAEDMEVEYEVHSFGEFDAFVAARREATRS